MCTTYVYNAMCCSRPSSPPPPADAPHIAHHKILQIASDVEICDRKSAVRLKQRKQTLTTAHTYTHIQPVEDEAQNEKRKI